MPSPTRKVASAFPPGGPSDATTSILHRGVEQSDGAPQDVMMALEDAEHLMQRGFLVRRRGQRLTDFEKRGQPADFGRVAARRFRLHGSSAAWHRVSPRPEAARTEARAVPTGSGANVRTQQAFSGVF